MKKENNVNLTGSLKANLTITIVCVIIAIIDAFFLVLSIKIHIKYGVYFFGSALALCLLMTVYCGWPVLKQAIKNYRDKRTGKIFESMFIN